MGVQSITESILSKAEAAAEARLAAAQSAKADKLAAANKELQKEAKQKEENLAAESAEIKQRRATLARLESRIAVLGIKQNLIDKTYAAAAEKLDKMSDSLYKDMYATLIARYAEKGDELRIGSADTKTLDKKWSDEMCVKCGMSIGGVFDGKGVILSGKVAEKDLSLAVLLAEAREKTESDVAGILFGQE